MKNEYFPLPNENRMRNTIKNNGVEQWDIKAARNSFLNTKNKFLYQLVKQRFSWMNDYIPDSAKNIIELGGGAGL